MICELGNFQSFIGVNMGFCIAYLALPRFRYRHRIQDAFLHFHKEKNACIAQYLERKKVENGEQKNENSVTEAEDTSAFRDSYLTSITETEKLFGKNKYGSMFFRHCFQPKTGIGIGNDQKCVSILVVALYVLLSITTIWPKYPTSAWLLPFVGCGFFTTLFLMKSGIKHASKIETLLKETLRHVKSTYSIDQREQHEVSISKMITTIS